jgi:hypothetical protein
MSDQPKQTNADEIDLGQLFQFIGNGINSVIQGIRKFFLLIFDLIIQFLLIVRRFTIHLIVIGLLSGCIGYYLDKIKATTYEAIMVVEPNFNSVQQLYNNIQFYNDLARSKDSVSLSRILEISSSESAKINEVSIDSYTDENQKIEMFDQFIRNLDSSTVKSIDVEKYLANFNSLNARFHRVTLITTDPYLPSRVQNTIISSISTNSYFQTQKQASDKNLHLQDQLYNKQLIEIDSLIRFTQKVTLLQAENPMQGTNISMAEGSSNYRELELIKEREAIKERIIRLNIEKANKETILNVISNFPAQGAEQKGFWDRYLFVIPTISITFFFLILLILGVNKYLVDYKKTRN